LAQMEDIAAMKLSAISGRGTKKDFIDLYFLLRHFKLREIMQYYNRKYHDGSEFLVLKSLTYFEDADPDQSPVMLQPIEWDKIKEAIIKQVENYS